MATRHVGFIGFDGLTSLDLCGPLEAFATAAQGGGSASPRYVCHVLSPTGRPFVAESGLIFQPHAALADAPELDTIVIPGGPGLRTPAIAEPIVAWLRERAGASRRVASVCTGLYALAATGLMDGRRVTTHWGFVEDIARRFPALRVEPDAIFVKDGPYYSSAGVTSGIDLALALIESDLGSRAALAVARELVVYLKRHGGQAQYSEPLQFQARSGDRWQELVAWISANLDSDLTVPVLAARACLSERQFARRFHHTFGMSPARFVERLRVDEARRRLSDTTGSIEQIAVSVGFHGADVFRRAFERHFHIAPAAYRERFSPPARTPSAADA